MSKRTATHRGTCQICGAVQKLPAGVLSLHGYNVKWGFFSGICSGASGKPFEQSTDLIEAAVERAEAQIADLEATAAKWTEFATENLAWIHHYEKIKKNGFSMGGKYRWMQFPLTMETKQYEDGGYVFCRFFYTTEDGKKEEFSVGYGNYEITSVEAAVTFANRKYVLYEIQPRIKQLRRYVEWQRDRVAKWQPAPLFPIETAAYEEASK